MNVQPDLEFIKYLKSSRWRYPEEMLSVCHLFCCLSSFHGYETFSSERDDLGSVGTQG